MGWTFCVATVAGILIFFVEWPKLKNKPVRDKATFITLLILGWGMFYLDLPHIPGPTELMKKIYEPFHGILR